MLAALYMAWLTNDNLMGVIIFIEWFLNSALSVNTGGCPLIVSMLIHFQIAIAVVSLNICSTVLTESIQKLNRVRAGGRS